MQETNPPSISASINPKGSVYTISSVADEVFGEFQKTFQSEVGGNTNGQEKFSGQESNLPKESTLLSKEAEGTASLNNRDPATTAEELQKRLGNIVKEISELDPSKDTYQEALIALV